MPEMKCGKCGHITNTALCDWINGINNQAATCYARITEDGESWEKGCGFDSADGFTRRYCERMFLPVEKHIDWNSDEGKKVCSVST